MLTPLTTLSDSPLALRVVVAAFVPPLSWQTLTVCCTFHYCSSNRACGANSSHTTGKPHTHTNSTLDVALFHAGRHHTQRISSFHVAATLLMRLTVERVIQAPATCFSHCRLSTLPTARDTAELLPAPRPALSWFSSQTCWVTALAISSTVWPSSTLLHWSDPLVPALPTPYCILHTACRTMCRSSTAGHGQYSIELHSPHRLLVRARMSVRVLCAECRCSGCTRRSKRVSEQREGQ